MEAKVAPHVEESGEMTEAGQSLPKLKWSWARPHKSCYRLPGAGESARGGHLVHRFHLQKRWYDFPQDTQLWKDHDYSPSHLNHSLHETLGQVMLSSLFRLPGSTEHLYGYGLLLPSHCEIFKLLLSHSEARCINSIHEGKRQTTRDVISTYIKTKISVPWIHKQPFMLIRKQPIAHQPPVAPPPQQAPSLISLPP